MLRTPVVRQAFSSGSFNILAPFKTLNKFVSAPWRHLRGAISPDGSYKNLQPNITSDLFEEQAHEYQALFTHNPYHLQVYTQLENVQTTNFGTIDNPCVVFTADAPFRYVGCTGLQNEDDYEQHEMMVFMLREGPLQRCPVCGQVFKLIRLRNEQSDEMDYWKTSFHPIDPRDFDNENIAMMNMFKINTHWEPTLFESQLQDSVIQLVNPDDHDRILVDPAYRLWKTSYAESKFRVVTDVMNQIDAYVTANSVVLKSPVAKVTYENSVEAEKAWAILERQRKKYQRFLVREFLDTENHERREKRMTERAKQRWDNNYTVFYGGLTEEEQRYNDYYQTDNELYYEDEVVEQQLDELQILSQGEFNPKNFDFQELYSHSPEDDQTSFLQKKLFKFKYRLAEDGMEKYLQRQKKVVQRQIQRMTQDENIKAVFALLDQAYKSNNSTAIQVAETKYTQMAAKEGFQMYKDYYEGDESADLQLVEKLFQAQPTNFVSVFKNYAAQCEEKSGYYTIPKRPWNDSLGVVQNLALDSLLYYETIQPISQQLANRGVYEQALPESEQRLLELGLLEAENVAKDQIESQAEQ